MKAHYNLNLKKINLFFGFFSLTSNSLSFINFKIKTQITIFKNNPKPKIFNFLIIQVNNIIIYIYCLERI